MKTTLWLITTVLIETTDVELSLLWIILFALVLPASMFLDLVDLIAAVDYINKEDDE